MRKPTPAGSGFSDTAGSGTPNVRRKSRVINGFDGLEMARALYGPPEAALPPIAPYTTTPVLTPAEIRERRIARSARRLELAVERELRRARR